MRVWFNMTYSSVYAAIRLIREADVQSEYCILYSNANPHTLAGRVAHEFFVEPTDVKGEAYVDWCLEVCRERRIDIFWPGWEARRISAVSERFAAQGTRVLSVATAEVLALLHDKEFFYQTVNLTSAPPPEFRRFSNIDQFNEGHAELRERHDTLCIKPSSSVYGIGFSILDEERNSVRILLEGSQYRIGLSDLRRGLEEIDLLPSMLLMEYLDGIEYSVDCVGNHGAIVCAIPRKKSLLGGRGQIIDLRSDIMEAVRQLCAAYQLNGIFNVQFREGNGKLRLLEINARMSGGIGMACLAGPNLPYIALAGFNHGYETVIVPPIASGIRVAELSLPVEIE